MLEHLSKIINGFCFYSIKTIKKLHYWVAKDREESHPIKFFIIILLGINGFIAWNLIAPNTLNFLGISSEYYIGITIAIFATIIGVLKWGIFGILGELRGEKVDIPAGYQFIGLLLSIPLLIFINKFIIWIKAINKNYESKIKADN